MKHEDKFDEIISNKLNSQEFPFDEANWEKAAAMIDASRKSKNRAGFWIFSTLIVLTCGVIGFYTIGNVASNDTEQLAQSNEVAMQNAQTMASSVVIPDASSNAEKNSEVGPASVPTENNSTANTASSETIKANINSETTSKANNDIASVVNKAEINLTKRASASSKLSSTSDVAENNTSSSKDKVASKSINNALIPTSKSNPDQIAGKEAVSQPEAAAKTNLPSGTKIESKVPEVKTEKNPSILPKSGDQTVSGPENGNTNKVENPTTTTEKTETAVVAVDSSSKEIAKNTKIDTASTTATISKPEEPKLHKNLLSLEAGADYLMGWQNPGSKDANGLNPILGINYTRFFNRHIGLSIGVQYNSVAHLNYSSHVSTDTHYAFGQENDVTVITPTKLHYIVAPFKINFAINPKNIFGVGCNVAYLMNVDNKVETYNTRLNYVSDHHISKTKGYVSGINPWDTQLSVFYRRTLFKDLSINAEVIYGMNDVKDNTFFNSNVYERNVGFKLTLLLNLFKK
jgi:hypothetical protein